MSTRHQSSADAHPTAAKIPSDTRATAPTRRTFLGWLAALVPAVGGVWQPRLWLSRLEQLDESLLLALGEAVLPSEIGGEGIRRAATALQKWIAGYRVDAELNHPYGSARIRTTGADPSTRWALQLRSLEVDARRAHGRGFAAIAPEERRVLVRSQLTADNVTALPGDIAGAGHVAVALLGLFYASPEATDLCYEAAIARNACRPLAPVAQRPVPLRRGGPRP
jgi:hypothetical protein